MNEEQQFKLQAFLDGELPERGAREILALTQRDQNAAQLLAELKHTRQAITKSESHPVLPESREFYWSKIQREILRQETRETSAPTVSVFDSLRRWLLPVTAAAALAIAGLIGYQHFGAGGKPVIAEAPQVEMTLADADAVTYQDQEENTTLVWLSYPADEQNKTARTL